MHCGTEHRTLTRCQLLNERLEVSIIFSLEILIGGNIYHCTTYLSKHLCFYFLASCPSPVGIDHGTKVGFDYRHGKTVSYQCDAEYTLKGIDRLTCNNGRWSNDPPECKGKFQKCTRLYNYIKKM